MVEDAERVEGDVRAQYEAYPYPSRNPADEAKRLITGSPSHLLELNHYVFAGRRDFRAPFRALVAGGGTGDGAIMLAQQLAERGDAGEVIYADPSRAARAIAEARARARGLANIVFHSAAIEELPALGLGAFDYIDCCGVLHHLTDPVAGMRILAGLLAARGGLGVMVYGPLGRTGVYPLQTLIRLLAGDEADRERLTLARRLLPQLPATNWFRRNPFVRDYIEGGDAGLYDLLLHARDRAFRVPEVVELASQAGLRITAFVDPVVYDPVHYVSDPALLQRLNRLDWLERCAAAELLAGNMRRHVFYAARADDPGPNVAAPGDGDAVPHLWPAPGEDLLSSVRPSGALSAVVDGIAFRFPLPPLARAIVERIDGERTLAAIHGELAALNKDLGWERFAAQFARLYAALNGLGKLYLAYLPRG